MRLQFKKKQYEVRLSERNLIALLVKLYTKDSARRIDTDYVIGEDYTRYPNLTFVVIAEKDDVHYQDRDIPPGEMSLPTEQLISKVRSVLERELDAGT